MYHPARQDGWPKHRSVTISLFVRLKISFIVSGEIVCDIKKP